VETVISISSLCRSYEWNFYSVLDPCRACYSTMQDGNTAVMKGSALGLIDVVQALLSKDANIDIKNKVRKCVKDVDSLWRGFKSLGVTE